MLTITQGYDFAIPSYSRKFSLRYPMQFFLNWLMNGKWLAQPLRIKGIYKQHDQKSIIKAMIYELNYMMSHLARSGRYPNLYHINAVGTARSPKDWFDELHLKSHGYRKVAKSYEKVIQMHFAEQGRQPPQSVADKVVETN